MGLEIQREILHAGHHEGHPDEYHHQHKNDHKTFKMRNHRHPPEALVVNKHWRRAEYLALQAFIFQVTIRFSENLPARLICFCGFAI